MSGSFYFFIGTDIWLLPIFCYWESFKLYNRVKPSSSLRWFFFSSHTAILSFLSGGSKLYRPSRELSWEPRSHASNLPGRMLMVLSVRGRKPLTKVCPTHSPSCKVPQQTPSCCRYHKLLPKARLPKLLLTRNVNTVSSKVRKQRFLFDH